MLDQVITSSRAQITVGSRRNGLRTAGLRITLRKALKVPKRRTAFSSPDSVPNMLRISPGRGRNRTVKRPIGVNAIITGIDVKLVPISRVEPAAPVAVLLN